MNHTTKRPQRLMLTLAALALAALGAPAVPMAGAGDLPPGPNLALTCRACNTNGNGIYEGPTAAVAHVPPGPGAVGPEI